MKKETLLLHLKVITWAWAASALHQEAHTYKAIIQSPAGITGQYALPQAEASGLVMRMHKKENKVELVVNSSDAADIKKYRQAVTV